jgi:hypothetical protein
VVERGSFITSISNMAKEINLSEKQIRLALNKLKRTSEVASKGTTQHTVIQVVKYDQYQQEGEQQGKRGANEGQTRGEQRATNKNVKNDKNDKKDRPDSLEAVISYMRERGFSNPVVTGHKWYDYYTANGWKVGRNPMKDWRASVRTWEKEHKGSTTNTPTYKKLG